MQFVMSNYDHYSSVSEMLSMLHLSRLNGRRNAHSLSTFCKILNNFIVTPGHVQNRGHNNKFIPIQPCIDAYKFSFYPRVLLWNNLPSNIVNAKTYICI